MRGPVLIVCQAGPSIGLGHLSRMRVAARALQRHLPQLPVSLRAQAPTLPDDPFQGLDGRRLAPELPLCDAVDAELAALRRQRPGARPVLLLDLAPVARPQALAGALQDWRREGVRCLAIDGLLDLRGQLDGVYLPSFRLPGGERRALCAPASGLAPVHHGWDCLLVETVAPPVGADPVDVLLLSGGSDVSGLGAHWPHQIDAALAAGGRAHWVRGPYARAPRLPAADSARLHWQVHEAPPTLGTLMARSRLAATVFGVSAFELMAHGVPSVLFSPYGGRDDDELEELAGLGIAEVVDDASAATAALQRLQTEPDRAQALGRRARACLARADGRALAACVGQLLAS